MIADLKPYPEYKASGLLWASALPLHWMTKRGKSYLVTIDQRSTAGREELLTVSSARGVVPRSSANVTMFKAASYAGHKLCWPGDLVINSLWAWAGGLGVSQHHGIISTAYSVYRSRPSAQINPRFLHELVRSSAFHWELQVRSKGVWISRLQLTDTSFLDAPIPLPPADEQTAIVRFLDWANGRLERAIRAKRKVIALLNEQKQAIIHRAVTRGLDPSVPLKPSGIPWLGDIPQHWEVTAIGAASELIQTGPFGSQLHSHEYIAAGLPVINPSHMADGRIVPSHTVTISKEKAHDLSRHMLRTGDIVIARRGELGRCALVTQEEEGWICGTGSLLLRCKRSSLVPAFFQVVFASRGIADMLSLASIGATMANLNAGTVARQRVPLPPLAEQERIVGFIEQERHKVNTAIARLEREIELLREYRTRLVADVVTGKLDVREAAARLPGETSPDIAEDDTDPSLDPEAANEEPVA